jgi:copper(I)-binding protein
MNNGDRPVRLVSASCGCAASVMIHQTETSNGVTVMDSAPRVIIPAHGMIRFQPDGLHFMIMGLKKPLIGGAQQDMILMFDHAGPLTVRFSVQARIHETPMADMPGMSGR